MVTLLNTEVANYDTIYECLQYENLTLHNQVQDLTRELSSMIAVSIPPTSIPARIIENAPATSDPRTVAVAAE